MTNYDIHIHTHLSSCGDRNAFISDYASSARALGLTLIGFSDHAWDETIPGASPWYQPQGYQRLISRRAEAKSECRDGLTVKLGAEGEFANFVLGLGESGAELVDYVIVPHSHTHMKGFVLPSSCDTPEKHADYLIRSFIALCESPKRELFFGIAHPFLPVGQSEEGTEAILSHISQRELEECALSAKQASLFLELNLSAFARVPESSIDGNCYSRVIRTFASSGANMFLGSDAHSPKAFSALHSRREEIISELGISEDVFKAAEHRILTL